MKLSAVAASAAFALALVIGAPVQADCPGHEQTVQSPAPTPTQTSGADEKTSG